MIRANRSIKLGLSGSDMLRLSKKADYALMAMKHLALREDRGSDRASSAREIAEQYDIPIELMAKVLQRLVRRGLLASHQGFALPESVGHRPQRHGHSKQYEAEDASGCVVGRRRVVGECDENLLYEDGQSGDRGNEKGIPVVRKN